MVIRNLQILKNTKVHHDYLHAEEHDKAEIEKEYCMKQLRQEFTYHRREKACIPYSFQGHGNSESTSEEHNGQEKYVRNVRMDIATVTY